ncbi:MULTISPECIES: sigma-70 family RNA polymerase sigma factor [Clostridium]|uniref:sigma-70 family RNA polymerase sigma factor n=1 Tax=Clostridium TaxID=1485 RepID=UPI000825F3C9|nr:MULTISPECIES: sigma-70 family RNA polymerase sigma factor [Clostridium]PJI09077.1 RNA polymerase subunit sigma-70 [Clostridium sp. CT7]
MEQNDEKIVEGILKKDMYALNNLIDAYGGIIHNVAASVLNESHESESIEECTDDILMCLWRNMDCFSKERGNLKCWIIVISKNKALTYKKKLKKLKRNIDLDKVKIDSSVNVEEEYLKEENKESVQKLLNNLKIRDKEIFVKRYIKGEDIEEIAEEMNLTSISIYNRLSRGRKKLKKILSSGRGV